MNVIKKIWMPITIVVILAVFGGAIYYNNEIKPKKDIDKEAGYETEEYITLGEYKGIAYELTQDMFDESVNEEIESYAEVKRAAQDGDCIEITYKGFIDGKKDTNISEANCELYIGQEQDLYKEFADAVIGHKKGETIEVESNNATYVSEDESDYSGKNVTFKIAIVSISQKETEEVTDEWVKDNYSEDYGLENKKDFYEWNEEYMIQNSKTEIWQKVVDASTMNGYPQELYDDVKAEFDADAAYYADMYGIEVDAYLTDFVGYDEESLEQEYLNEVKSELVMWALVKEEDIKVSDSEVEEKYEELFMEYGYESIDDMKNDYTKKEIKEAVYLDKAMEFVYDNGNINKAYTLPTV